MKAEPTNIDLESDSLAELCTGSQQDWYIGIDSSVHAVAVLLPVARCSSVMLTALMSRRRNYPSLSDQTCSLLTTY